MKKHVEIIPLGGVGQFGMNCTVIRCGDDMILVDAGMTFPGGDLGTNMGVDVIVPDISFIREHQDQLRAILLTHGHEDHSGAVSYVINEVPVPVYGSRLTLGMVGARLKERRLYDSAQLNIIEARDRLTFGALEIEALHVTHSFPDSFCFAISTPAGRLIWTGDYKLDQTPIDHKLTDISRLSKYGEEGVLALFSDSTNSEVPGLASSEFSIYEPLRALFRKTGQRIIVSCFASSIHRIQIILDLAQEFGRKVATVGRSMVSNTKTAAALGYLHFPEDLLVPSGEVKNLPRDQIVVLASGSQGEPLAALSRLAVDEFKGISVEEGDTVILSARIIPGNEKLVSNVTNHFYRRGAHVYDSRTSNVHASGHGLQDDLKLMINVTRPKFFIPIHGEIRQLKCHAALARDQGIPEERTLIIENGDILRLTADAARITGKIKVGRRFIELAEEVHEVVLRDRRYLSEDGFLVVVLRLDRFTGDLIGLPELVSRGFVLMDNSEELMEATGREVSAIVADTPQEEKQDEELFKEIIRKKLRRFLRKQTGKRPMILPVTIET